MRRFLVPSCGVRPNQMNFHRLAEMNRGNWLLLLIVLCSCAVVTGQQAKAVRTDVTDRARLDMLRKEGFEALYNLDYEGANRRFKELARLFPDHPAGPQFLAAALWAQTLNQSRRLQASLYSSDSFYEQSEDKVDPRTVAQFRAWTREAKRLAEVRLKRDPRDVEALYFLGAAEGLNAAFAVAVERRFMAALGDGSRSVDRHRQVIKLDPTFHDAELTIGIYDYTVGGLPLPVKLLASLGGVRGSKKRGLETLERVAKEGRWAGDDARSLLLVLYKREKRFDDALAISREMSAKYPRNYLFKLESADSLISQAALARKENKPDVAASAEREAFGIFDALLRDRTAAHYFDLIHFRYGEALLQAGQPERASREFLAAANLNGAEPSLVTMAHLRAAQSLDLAAKRTEALAEYRVVLARPDVYNAHEEAKRGLREPYKR
jgi:tetratricopeptide (TPR) repeat protein